MVFLIHPFTDQVPRLAVQPDLGGVRYLLDQDDDIHD